MVQTPLKTHGCSQVDFIEWAEVHFQIRRMARERNNSPALPIELWGQVASFMTMRESCMLASTCRALWAMDLLSVAVLQGESRTECELLKERSRLAPSDGSALYCSCSAGLVMYDV